MARGASRILSQRPLAAYLYLTISRHKPAAPKTPNRTLPWALAPAVKWCLPGERVPAVCNGRNHASPLSHTCLGLPPAGAATGRQLRSNIAVGTALALARLLMPPCSGLTCTSAKLPDKLTSAELPSLLCLCRYSEYTNPGYTAQDLATNPTKQGTG